ncbi:hypothetical protein ABIB73_007636 [Bradyrhizobium sp. F1.4.3]
MAASSASGVNGLRRQRAAPRHHRVVVDNENMALTFCPRLGFPFRRLKN